MLKKKYLKSKDEYEVTFQLPTDAEEVTLLCEANGWEPVAMKKSKGTCRQAAPAGQRQLPVSLPRQQRRVGERRRGRQVRPERARHDQQRR